MYFYTKIYLHCDAKRADAFSTEVVQIKFVLIIHRKQGLSCFELKIIHLLDTLMKSKYRFTLICEAEFECFIDDYRYISILYFDVAFNRD